MHIRKDKNMSYKSESLSNEFEIERGRCHV